MCGDLLGRHQNIKIEVISLNLGHWISLCLSVQGATVINCHLSRQRDKRWWGAFSSLIDHWAGEDSRLENLQICIAMKRWVGFGHTLFEDRRTRCWLLLLISLVFCRYNKLTSSAFGYIGTKPWTSSSSSGCSSSMTIFHERVLTPLSSFVTLFLCKIYKCSCAPLYGFGVGRGKEQWAPASWEYYSAFSLETLKAKNSVILANSSISSSGDDEESPPCLLFSSSPSSLSQAMMFATTSKAAFFISSKESHLLSLHNRQNLESKALA